MITIQIERVDGAYHRLHCSGHARYAKRGSDIVCAAASILVINTLNAMEKLAETTFEVSSDQTDGRIEAVFPDTLNEKATLLLDAMTMGLDEISKQYGSKYINLQIKEAAL